MSELSLPMYTREKNYVQFSEHAVRNEIASERMGRAMFDKILRIHIAVPGEKDVQPYEVDREFAEGHPLYKTTRRNETIYKRFGEYIEQYKKNSAAQVVTGTPIEMWPHLDIRMVATLKSLGIHSVEALAEISDANIPKLGIGGRDLVRKAKEYLSSASNAAAASQLAAEKKVLEDRLTQMETQLKDLADAFAAQPDAVQAQIKDALRQRGHKVKAA